VWLFCQDPVAQRACRVAQQDSPDRPAIKSSRPTNGRFSEVVIVSKVTRSCSVLECVNATRTGKIRKTPF